ncbi:GH116 family glycosyl hydrolase [Leptothermofonsia sp. ETS-13]|uniref:GH116 family glycosyl hydrolase n=1 Tax=Leptothermofonsia sp. ETS-13 TaxID=3035696 RepID=UPI003BA1C7C5
MQNQKQLPQIPACAWKRAIGLGWEKPYTVRYASNLDDGPFHGMPLGGFGAGCIGRSHRGDFNLWHIDGGEHVFKSIPACQFSVFEQIGEASQSYALCTEAPEDGSLSSWRWYPVTETRSQEPGAAHNTRHTGTYHALYPRSWFVYENVFQAALACEQFSPIIAHNYRETSYPVAIFEWTTHNPTSEPITLSIMLTWQNMVGWFTNGLKSSEVRIRDDGSPVYEYQPRLGESVGNFNSLTRDEHQLGIVMGRQETGEQGKERRKKAERGKETRRQETGIGDWELGDRGQVLGQLRTQHLSTHPPIYSSISSLRTNNQSLTTDPPPAEGDGQWSIATLLNPDLYEVFYHTRWNPVGDGADLWRSFAADGSLPDIDDETPAVEGEQIGGAIAVRFTLQPGQTRKIPFVLSWDFPVTEFAQGVEYLRRYTDFFGRNGQNGWAIGRTALKHYPTWREQIQTWQQPILDRKDLPDWFKMALLNELYNLTDGGTLWSAADERDPVGQFAVLECIDYRWYESLDVRLYGSFALLHLFPELEKAVMRAFARAIPARDDRTRVIGYYTTIGAESPKAIRKVAGATPHDLGAPNEHVWEKTNYTSYQDCNLWKDLPCDFVLQVYRDYLLTGATDGEFLVECWDAIVQTLTYLKTFDQDGDGIPENSGAPDQTFDDWKLQGISAYCGGLWLAALEAAIAIGHLLERETSSSESNPTQNSKLKTQISQFQSWLEQSRPIYQETLWNGQYYRIDSNSGSNIVMADQLCGQFYARLLKLPDIIPEECAQMALRTVYDTCFLKFNQYLMSGALKAQTFTSVQEARVAEEQEEERGKQEKKRGKEEEVKRQEIGIGGWGLGVRDQALGQLTTHPPIHPSTSSLRTKSQTLTTALGAANGVRPDGSPENPNATHPLEVWTGINFGVAAFLMQMGMGEEAFTLTKSVVQQIYENGLQFRTPEAITASGTFRACHYLRATAIWAIYQVLILQERSP